MSIPSGILIVLQANVALQAERSGGQGFSQGAEPAKENRAEAKPLHERDF